MSNPTHEQLSDYQQAKGTARPAIDKLFEVGDITGRLDVPPYRAFTRAHDLALALGHRSVDCVHMVMGLVLEPKSRAYFSAAEPNFNLVGVLQAGRSHLSDPELAHSLDGAETLAPSDDLTEWFMAAERLTGVRGERNRFIEVADLVRATPTPDEKGAFLKALELLKTAKIPTLREFTDERVSSAAQDVKNSVDNAAKQVNTNMMTVARAVIHKIEECDGSSRDRHGETRLRIYRFRRSFNRISRRLSRKSDAMLQRLGAVDERIGGVESQVGIGLPRRIQALDDAVSKSRTTVMSELADLRTVCETTLSLAAALRGESLSRPALIAGLLFSIVTGSAAGYFLSV